MLDYEIYKYKLKFRPRYARSFFVKEFSSEDEAIKYIKANREDWASFRLQKIHKAIIDF